MKQRDRAAAMYFTAIRDGRYTTLPHHGNQDLGRSLIRQILREIEIAPEEFIRLLKEI